MFYFEWRYIYTGIYTGIAEMARNADSELTRLVAWRELLDRG